ncbi:MAG: molecular chaperone DnaJ [Rhizobiales bacterium 62-17]|nr:J domain-containing protein [Hyphomicrobiales bacterium]OJX99804.1 MAG: molecular chaperone DnaJ [Rhizobiales bacterium 62-17]
MNLNSPLFDRIRTKGEPQERPAEPVRVRCNHPGCDLAGEYRAPMGRDREGQYFCFCMDHVREYNNSYNYFKGMSDEDVARYQKDALIGHRPTWTMGTKRGASGFREDGVDPAGFVDPMGLFRAQERAHQAATARPRLPVATAKALAVMNLEESADAQTVRARYKELVKRLHPDANGGDRSREEKLREIIQAYKHLRSVKLA